MRLRFERAFRAHYLAVLVTAALALAGAIGISRSASASTSSSGVFSSDHGKFRILVSGQDVGKEEFNLEPGGGGWVLRSTSTIQSAQGEMHVSGTLQLREDGTPAHYEWETQGAKKASSTIEFSGASATVQLHIEGARPFTQQFTFNSPRVIVLDNNLYAQYSVLARLYDWDKKGSQTFAVIVPQEMTPGTVTVVSVGKQDAGGKKLDELVVKTEDLELDLYLDGPKLVRIVVPSSNAEIVRE